MVAIATFDIRKYLLTLPNSIPITNAALLISPCIGSYLPARAPANFADALKYLISHSRLM